MTSWLGITILLVFSLGLNLFMRLERKPARSLPANLGKWERSSPQSGDGSPEALTYEERRLWFHAGTLLRKHRLVEQRRTRRLSDHEIVEVLPERVLETWRGA